MGETIRESGRVTGDGADGVVVDANTDIDLAVLNLCIHDGDSRTKRYR